MDFVDVYDNRKCNYMKNPFKVKKSIAPFRKSDPWSTVNPVLLWRAYIIVAFLVFIGACVFSFFYYNKISEISFSENETAGTVEVESINTEKMQKILSKYEEREYRFISNGVTEYGEIPDPSR